MSVPVFNNGDNNFPPSFLFCGNPKCEIHGLLTVAYKMLDKEPSNGNKKGKRKTV